MDTNENVLEKKVSRLEVLLSFGMTLQLELDGKGKTVRESIEEFFKTRSIVDIVHSKAMRWYDQFPHEIILNDAVSLTRLGAYENEEVGLLFNEVGVKGEQPCT